MLSFKQGPKRFLLSKYNQNDTIYDDIYFSVLENQGTTHVWDMTSLIPNTFTFCSKCDPWSDTVSIL